MQNESRVTTVAWSEVNQASQIGTVWALMWDDLALVGGGAEGSGLIQIPKESLKL
jgi:hypothetical protein